jgi:hypothetical protein
MNTETAMSYESVAEYLWPDIRVIQRGDRILIIRPIDQGLTIERRQQIIDGLQSLGD